MSKNIWGEDLPTSIVEWSLLSSVIIWVDLSLLSAILTVDGKSYGEDDVRVRCLAEMAWDDSDDVVVGIFTSLCELKTSLE